MLRAPRRLFCAYASGFKFRAADARILTALLRVRILLATPDKSCVQSGAFLVVLRREIARFNFLHPATWYLNFTLRTDVFARLFLFAQSFKSTTRRADEYRPATLLRSLYSLSFIKRPLGILSSPSRCRRATVLKQALLHCF